MNDHLKTTMSIAARHNGVALYSDMTPRPAQVLCIALIDSLKLSRECFISAAFITQPLLAITPLVSIKEFLRSDPGQADLVVYMHHDHDAQPLQELLLILRHVPAQSLVIISESVSQETSPLLQDLESRSVNVINAQDTALQSVISMLYLIRHGRHNGHAHHAAEPARAELHALDLSEDFTKRERTVLQLVRQGKTNKEIALVLQTSISTVKAHVRNIMQKAGVTNRIQLALGMHRPGGARPPGSDPHP